MKKLLNSRNQELDSPVHRHARWPGQTHSWKQMPESKRRSPGLSPKEILKLAEPWRPWRSYANMCLWNSLLRRGENRMYVTEYDSSVRRLLLGSDGTALTGLWMEGQKYFGGTGKELMEKQDSLPVFDAAKDWLDRYFAGKRLCGVRASPCAFRESRLSGGMENSFGDSLWNRDHLRSYCGKRLRKRETARPCRRRPSAARWGSPDFHYNPLPPRRGVSRPATGYLRAGWRGRVAFGAWRGWGRGKVR